MFAEIAFPIPVHRTFTYQVPAGLPVQPLHRVLVPFGKKQRVGLVVSLHSNPPTVKTKPIESVLDEASFFSPLYWEWLEWASRYYLTPIGEVLLSAVPNLFFKPHTSQKLASLKTRSSPIKGHYENTKRVELSEKQSVIFKDLETAFHRNEFYPALLHGITGSGKTEIYLHLIEQMVAAEKQVIFLVPEIGLTPQMVARFQSYFGKKLNVYHSALTENQRLGEWLRAKSGDACVTVGTRSALFMPYSNLGGIFLDEEHDSSYKQEERFRYHARDLAMVRGKMENAMVVLGSATPSIESFFNARGKKYHYYSLPERPGQIQMPKIHLIDLAAQKRQTGSPLSLCRELHESIEANLKKGHQTLILLNRRGFARSFLCLGCQTPAACPNCTISLIYHKSERALRCHYCDFSIPLPKTCPSCNSTEVTLLGQGTETVEEELKTFFPRARIARLDRDSTQKKGALFQILDSLRNREIDILVGTQMIAKGHDLPLVTLVGVVGIDAELTLPDFRSGERAFQLLMQVAGRAGRSKDPGRVIVQTYSPGHESIRFAVNQDFEAFYERELQNRQELGYPPAGRLVQFVLSATNDSTLRSTITQLEGKLRELEDKGQMAGIQILGPSPAPLEKLRGRHRWQLLLKAKEASRIKHGSVLVIEALDSLGLTAVKWAVDVDPLGML